MRGLEEWVIQVVERVPELRPLFDAQRKASGLIDPEVFLSTAARWCIRQGPSEPVDRLFATLDRDYATRGPKMRAAIEGAFIERIMGDDLVHRLGHNLRRASRPRDLGHR